MALPSCRQVVAVVPAHNEGDSLRATLQALEKLRRVDHIILVDDGSRDATARLAHAAGAEVIKAGPPCRPAGKGCALLRGLARARNYAPEAVLVSDADLGSTAACLSGLLERLDEAHPVAIAAFPPASGGGFGLVKSFARRAVYARTGYSAVEPLSGQRALLAPALDALPGLAPGFGAEVGMTLDLLADGIEPLEVPLPLRHRPTGRTPAGFAHRARQGVDVLRAVRGTRIPWPAG